MPSDLATWLVSVPNDGDAEGMVPEIAGKLSQTSKTLSRGNIAEIPIPTFKTGTLDALITLSEDMPKQDNYFTATVAKIVDTLRSLVNNDSRKLEQHTMVNDKPVDDYLLKGWKWNDGRYSLQKSLRDITETLNKEISSIDNVMKTKLNSYNLAKGTLVQLQRKQTGNLSVRSLAEVVQKDQFIQDSEYLETLLVAVPKNLTKEWNGKYERLTSMVVPRSSSNVTSDEEYTLFSVVVFKRVRDEFVQKCRENKFIVRDFAYSDDIVNKQNEELRTAEQTEKGLWTELLQLSRINFSEAFQVLVHLKVVRLFVESVLRYGLPANYIGVVIKPEPKSVGKTLNVLTNHFKYLAPRSNSNSSKKKTDNSEEVAGEYQQLLEQEFLDFVVYDVPWITD